MTRQDAQAKADEFHRRASRIFDSELLPSIARDHASEALGALRLLSGTLSRWDSLDATEPGLGSQTCDHAARIFLRIAQDNVCRAEVVAGFR